MKRSETSLAQRIEYAHARLVSQKRAPTTVYLTDQDCISGIDYEATKPGTEIGTYDQTVSLDAFKEDVIWTYTNRLRRAA